MVTARRCATALLAAGLVGCGAAGRLAAPPDLELRPVGAASSEVTIDQERRQALLTPLTPWSWEGTVPAGGTLRLGAQIVPRETAGGWFEVELAIEQGGRRESLTTARSTAQRWLDLDCDLSRLAGRRVRLELAARAEHADDETRVAWSPLNWTREVEAATGERPSVVLIVVDTLRADHLTTYGYERNTAPRIDRELAGRGVTMEQAYAQAPWTLPSVASYLTSRYPGELVGGDLGSFGIPPGVETLAQRLRGAGYVTGGFVANATLHAGNGFDRGFDTFYTPPATADSMLQHGEEINRRALPWLRARAGRPFFLYLHYIDPHDPYENPETASGRSPYFPTYQGPIGGRFVHGIYTGRIPLADPANDIRQVTALYDSEIHYVDARIGELLDAIPPAILANTLVVLTADHGEELHDHGGWKHGQTLYQEQIRVPLIARWDGRLPAGLRLAGAVRLLDLVPTVLAAAGLEASAGDQGVDLLAAWKGESALPRLPVVVEHLSSGPRRAAAIVEGRKLVLFDRRAPFLPADGLQEHLWRQDLGRLQRVELYDLATDPAERSNLAPGDPGAVARLQPWIHRQLDRELPGLRLMASGLPAGARLDGTIRFARPPERWSPYFLAAGDAIELRGRELRFVFGGEIPVKGALVEGDFGDVESLEARLDDGRGGAVRWLVGAGAAYRGGSLDAAALAARTEPQVPEQPALRLWISERGAISRHSEEDAETVKRLQALGYIQK